MKTKYFLLLAMSMVVGTLLFGALPARADTQSIVADNDTYVYESWPDQNYDAGLDAGARVSFGMIGAYQDIAYYHFPFTFKPEQFSSAVIYIYYDWADATFNANISLVSNNTWKENEITWNNRPLPGDVIATASISPPPSTIDKIAINVTDYITGTGGISICIGSSDTMVVGSARSLTQEDQGDPTLGYYVPVLTWTYVPAPPIWMYFIIIAVVAVVAVVVVVIKKRKGARSTTPEIPQVPMVPKESLIKEPPAPKESSAQQQTPDSKESPGSSGTPPPSDAPGPQEPPAL